MTTQDMGCADRYKRLVDEVVLGELPPGKWERLRDHLRGCDSCRERYNRVVLMERMLHGGPAALAGPSPTELARIGASLFAVDDARRSGWDRALQWFTPVRWGAAATLALALLLVPVIALRRPSPDGFQSRGGAAVDRQAGLRAFCLDGDRVLALDGKGAVPRCPSAANLKLTVTNPGRYQRVFLVGMDGQHNLKWYAPRPPETASVAAPVGPDAVDAPVGAALRLAVNHAPGPVRIYALFSDEPLRAAEVESAVGELAQRNVAPAAAATLPLRHGNVLQRSLLVEVQP